LSLAFTLFYPVAIATHLIGIGGWTDPALIALLDLPKQWHETMLPTAGVIAYVLLSLMATRWRWAWYLLIATATGVALYLFGQIP
jgi:hypothetical protein